MEQGEILTLEDGEKYVVVSMVTIGSSQYLYLANRKDYKKYLICEYYDDEVEEVDNPDLLETLLVKFNEDLKESLPKIIEKYF